MIKFQTNPEAEMRGATVEAIFTSLNYEQYSDMIDPIFKAHGITKIDPEKYYPAQVVLDLYKAMAKKGNSMFDFVAIGKEVATNLELPAHIKTIPDAVNFLNDMYGIQLRNYNKEEGYVVTKSTPTHIEVRDNTPYPHDMIYGYLYTLAHRFAPKGKRVTVQREYENKNKPDQGSGFYTITIKD